ncbi:MAG: primosomal protein N' [Phycisphaerae bacterium]|nr:primosomal protein N' [Gemmatimonadaceae bacterium]
MTNATATRCVSVALAAPLFRSFTYSVPDGIAMPIPRGARVVVSFRNRREVGVCLGEVEPPAGVALKPIDSVIDATTSFTEPLMQTAEWIANWYAAPLGMTLRAMLPSSLTVVDRKSTAVRTQRVARLVDELPSLLQREKLFARAPQQRAVYELLEAQGTSAPVDSLIKQAGCTAGVLKAMVKRGLITIQDESNPHDPFTERPVVVPPPQPTPAQQDAVRRILNGAPGQTFLLHGITGSGKTLVYIEVLRDIVKRQGRSAIVLVPEIALTPQTVDRFRGAFGNDVAVLHSALSDGERVDAWHALRQGDRRIAVGARSALFAPLSNVGVIIVDEEHEASYKQGETPRYHAREAAIIRARHEGAVTVLGSATPSLESWERSERGQSIRISLPERTGGGRLPAVTIVDLRAATREQVANKAPNSPYDPSFGVLSTPLAIGLESRLVRGEQSLLLLNRRGYASFMQCQMCGYVAECPHCSISLTYHRVPEGLVCHYCQHHDAVFDKCPQCNSDSVKRRGLGTQQVERLVAERFPTARLARMDVDTTGAKWSHAAILDRVSRGEVDILLGTQMIAKGLDFPNVTLVGVIDADTGLNLPDFRSNERTFQLLSQVAGRAGRGEKIGEVIVQTRMPDNHAIQHVATHAYLSFVRQELDERRDPAYPPFVSLANVILSGPDEAGTAQATIAAVDWVRRLLQRQNVAGVELVGPAPCAIDRIKDRWRWHFLLKSEKASILTRVAHYIAARYVLPRAGGLRLIVDRDPATLL